MNYTHCQNGIYIYIVVGLTNSTQKNQKFSIWFKSNEGEKLLKPTTPKTNKIKKKLTARCLRSLIWRLLRYLETNGSLRSSIAFGLFKGHGSIIHAITRRRSVDKTKIKFTRRFLIWIFVKERMVTMRTFLVNVHNFFVAQSQKMDSSGYTLVHTKV